ncbi:hypothetical protein HMPREF9182_0871 [Streptococcus sp. oral taxon 056 str. F0418]|nr:hypothetical protein HMPREF9182_0871 [Streptococcus sp. oral taxon 056 str. F0418]
MIAGSITAVTNSTIVAIRLHLLTDKRRRIFSASFFHITSCSITLFTQHCKKYVSDKVI